MSHALLLSPDTCQNEARNPLPDSLFHAVTDPLLLLDRDLCIVHVNEAACRLLGAGQDALIGRAWVDLHPPLTEIGHMQTLRAVLAGEGSRRSRIPFHDAATLSLRLMNVTTYPVRDPQSGQVTHLLEYAQDVSEEVHSQLQTVDDNRDLLALTQQLAEKTAALEAANARLEHIAIRDVMTDLPNHRAFQENLAGQIARSHRAGCPFSLLLFDVDGFKNYNDTFGHPQGDVLLACLAGVVRSVLREGDLPARYGGEEFAVLLPDTQKAGAADLAERLRGAIALFPFPGRRVTVSIGVAEFGNDIREGGPLVSCADRAMYQAKAAGRNTVRVWNDISG